MGERLRDMQGLGPQMEAWLGQVGVRTPAQLRACDPFEVYARLKARVPGANVNALYALIGAIEERSWLAVKRERRGEILIRLDAMGRGPR